VINHRPCGYDAVTKVSSKQLSPWRWCSYQGCRVKSYQLVNMLLPRHWVNSYQHVYDVVSEVLSKFYHPSDVVTKGVEWKLTNLRACCHQGILSIVTKVLIQYLPRCWASSYQGAEQIVNTLAIIQLSGCQVQKLPPVVAIWSSWCPFNRYRQGNCAVTKVLSKYLPPWWWCLGY
jgi:hypothetical protein